MNAHNPTARQLLASFRVPAILAIAAGAPLAAADVPGAMDRLPTGLEMVMVVPNVGNLQGAVKTLEDLFQFDPADMQMGIGMQILEAPGLKLDGSMAVAFVYPEGAGDDADEPGDVDDEDDADGQDDEVDDDADAGAGEDDDFGFEEMEGSAEPTAIAIVPVSDYGAFVRALGGDAAASLAELRSGDEVLFGKDLGGGYAALSDDSDALDAFAGKGGSLGAYTTLLGKTGARVAEASDVVFVINIPVMAPKMKEGLAGFREQLEMMGGMAQQDLGGASAMVQMLGDAFMRDGQSMIFGFDVAPEGVTIETGANFTEGSVTAGLLTDEGRASGLLGSLPSMAQGFLFAAAMDTSAPGMRDLLNRHIAELKAGGDPAAAGGGQLMNWLRKCDGAAAVVGTSPALMGGAGLFINTVVYGRSSDPASLLAEFKSTTEGVNGKTEEGVSFTSSYKPGAATVAGTPVDEWQVTMKMDPSDPNATNANMAQSMLFGAKGGPGGYVAPAQGGVVMTLGRNSALMETALKAAQGEGGTFAADAGVQAVASSLPEGRTFEGYIGVRDILNMALPMMAMFGMGAIDIEVPADLQPIGLGATSREGGLRVAIMLPTQVLKTFAELSEAVNGGMGGMEGMDENGQDGGGGRPRF